MNSRLSLALLVGCITLGFVFVRVEGQDKKPKEVIPHAQKKMPGPPLSPEEALKKMTVPPGFSVELVAAEPDLVNPVAMHIDEKGRFWITESLEYPKRAAGPGIDRVKVLEIGDDGKAKKVTTVIEGLNIPSGIAVGHGGVWVANSPDILFYPIEDFDNLKLGKPQVVVTGFGRDDTHELPNSLTWGPDGWLYGLNGVFNRSSVTQNGKTWNFTCALFRIHPKTKQFDIFCEGTSNPWGVTFNDNGDAFISACVIDHLWHLTQTGYYIRQGGPYPPFASKIGSIVKHKHQQAAYCGICWFDSDAYPEEYRKKLYMGNIHGNCINADELTRDGSTYFAKPRPDFLSANDAWFMPVVQKVGPDGCMYILDWYDRYHCYQDANRDPKGIDRLRGRLYRVRYKDTPRVKDFDLTKATNDKLVDSLGNANVYVRDQAQRLLCERLTATPASDVENKAAIATVDRLYKILEDKGESQEKRTRAFLCTILIPGWNERQFQLDSPVLRSWAIRSFADHNAEALEYWKGEANKISDKQERAKKSQHAIDYFSKFSRQITSLSTDSSIDVKLQVAIAARKLPGIDPVPVLIDVLNNCGSDKLIPHIVWQNLHPLLEERSDDFLKQVAKLDLDTSPNVLALMPRVVDRILAVKKQDPQALVSLVAVLGESPKSRDSAAKVLGMLNGKVQTGELAGANLKSFETRLLPVIQKLRESSANAALGLEATLLGAALKDGACLAAAHEMLLSPKQTESVRLKAVESLIAAGDLGVVDNARDLLTKKSTSPQFRGDMLAALGKLDTPKVAGLALENYKAMEPELKPRAIELLTQRAAWSSQLLGDIEAKKIPSSAVNVNQIRKLLAAKDPAMTKRVEAIWGTIREGRNPQREQVVAQMRDVIAKTPGDPNKGVLIYKKLCAQCHKLHGEGADVGPDITLNGRSDFDQLLSNVFDPSLVIGLGYRQTNVSTKAGQVINGLLVEDSAQRVVLKTQGGKIETIARGNVDEVTTSPLSYMPEDVERQLSPQEIADLFALLVLDRPPSDPAARKIPGTPR